ncbi:MAG: GHKL domain-containing protein [Desulfosarcina sp.]|nr:GHKL domain-containing protein [Desulfobacterales bacterium]
MPKISISSLKKLLPAIVFCLFAYGSYICWNIQKNHKHELILGYTKSFAEQIRICMEDLMQTNMAVMAIFANRWVEKRPADFSRDRFMQLAGAYYEHFPGFSMISLLDHKGLIQEIYPENKTSGSTDKQLISLFEAYKQKKIGKVGENPKLLVTACKAFDKKKFVFEASRPLINNGKIIGYLNSVFDVSLIMEVCKASSVFDDFYTNVYEGKRLIYTNRQKDGADYHENGMHIIRDINFPGKAWRLIVEPKTSVCSTPVLTKNLLLTLALAASAAIAFILYLLLQRIEMYQAATNNVIQEARKRKKIGETLKQNEKKLESLVDELEGKNEELEAFVFMISHDLKNSIFTIQGFTNALREDFGNLLSEKSGQYIRYIDNAAEKMNQLINDLLKLARIGRLIGRKENYNFELIVNEALQEIMPRIKERDIEIKVQENLPDIFGEKKRLVQIMENLLTNAVKYIGKENPAPHIEIGAEQQRGENVFFVRDNGIGIKKEFFKIIFQVFKRLHSAKKLAEGSGIGLAIVKRIVELHGGRIWLSSETGKGTTFFFTL